MLKLAVYFFVAVVTTVVALPMSAFAGGPVTDAPTYTDDGELIPPADYRQWVFLTSDMDLNYSKRAGSGHFFGNVFVNPEAYRSFLKTGTWPDKAVLVLEFRSASSEGSIAKHGYFQSGDAGGYEVHVKDKAQFKDGWAFFPIRGNEPAKQIPSSAACYSCHHAHGAVDTTFVQFYPTLLPIAKKHSTLSAAYLKDEAEVAKSSKQ